VIVFFFSLAGDDLDNAHPKIFDQVAPPLQFGMKTPSLAKRWGTIRGLQPRVKGKKLMLTFSKTKRKIRERKTQPPKTCSRSSQTVLDRHFDGLGVELGES
jgi:hypothetical protein